MPDFLSCHYKLQLIATTAYIDVRMQNILLKTFLNSSNYRVITTTLKRKFHIPFFCVLPQLKDLSLEKTVNQSRRKQHEGVPTGSGQVERRV